MGFLLEVTSLYNFLLVSGSIEALSEWWLSAKS